MAPSLVGPSTKKSKIMRNVNEGDEGSLVLVTRGETPTPPAPVLPPRGIAWPNKSRLNF